jgi:anthranilate synthase component 2
VVRPESLPERIVPTAVSTDDGEIMALQIRDLPVYGVQFHPESIMSEFGHEMLDNFLKL